MIAHGGLAMTRRPAHQRFPQLEALETRLQLSATIPANSIGTNQGTCCNPAA